LSDYTKITAVMKKRYLIILATLTLLLYLPIFVSPNIYLKRGNDLQEFFWPLIEYVKIHILKGEIPLWNTTILSGTPLLPDSQSPLFYLPNIIFLILPTGLTFIALSITHTFLSGISMYLLSRDGIHLNDNSSLVAASFYLLSPRLAGYIEAGHFGLIMSYAWIPFVLLATLRLTKQPSRSSVALLTFSLASIFFLHPLTFFVSAVASLILFLFYPKNSLKTYTYYLSSALITFGLVAVGLIPQLKWIPTTTRGLLVSNPDIYPKWRGKIDFIKTVFVPWIEGLSNLWEIDTEKWISLGIIPFFLALLGFLQIKGKKKVLLIAALISLVTFSLNNASPLFQIFLKMHWYSLFRVTTRVWFLVVILFSLLAGIGFQYLLLKKPKVALLFLSLALFELTFLSWLRISKPIAPSSKLENKELMEYLSSDTDIFRVFCLDRCISQKDAVEYGLELVDGYSTLIQTNYNQQMWQLSGSYWDYYTLAVPPVGSYKFNTPIPSAKSLGEFNTKYVISQYILNEVDFEFIDTYSNYYLYLNKSFLPRTNGAVLEYSPNRILIDVSSLSGNQLIINSTFSPGWVAYIDNTLIVNAIETPSARIAVDINPESKIVELKYEPLSAKLGITITAITLLLTTWQLYIFTKKNN